MLALLFDLQLFRRNIEVKLLSVYMKKIAQFLHDCGMIMLQGGVYYATDNSD